MNHITIIGRLTRDPELRTTTSGKSIASFSVAVDRRVKDKDGNKQADFFRVDAWGQLGDYAASYLTKGRLVAVSGRMEMREHEGKTYWQIVADTVQGLERVRDDAAAPTTSAGDEFDPFAE